MQRLLLHTHHVLSFYSAHLVDHCSYILNKLLIRSWKSLWEKAGTFAHTYRNVGVLCCFY